jgi:hypothetical protein
LAEEALDIVKVCVKFLVPPFKGEYDTAPIFPPSVNPLALSRDPGEVQELPSDFIEVNVVPLQYVFPPVFCE